MNEITARTVAMGMVGWFGSKAQQETLFIWTNNVQELPVAQIVLLDDEHFLSVGSSKKVFIHMDSVLSDISLIGCQLSNGFTMVKDLKCVDE